MVSGWWSAFLWPGGNEVGPGAGVGEGGEGAACGVEVFDGQFDGAFDGFIEDADDAVLADGPQAAGALWAWRCWAVLVGVAAAVGAGWAFGQAFEADLADAAVDVQGQFLLGGVMEFQGEGAVPAGFEWGCVDDEAAACVGGLAVAGADDVFRDAEAFDGGGEDHFSRAQDVAVFDADFFPFAVMERVEPCAGWAQKGAGQAGVVAAGAEAGARVAGLAVEEGVDHAGFGKDADLSVGEDHNDVSLVAWQGCVKIAPDLCQWGCVMWAGAFVGALRRFIVGTLSEAAEEMRDSRLDDPRAVRFLAVVALVESHGLYGWQLNAARQPLVKSGARSLWQIEYPTLEQLWVRGWLSRTVPVRRLPVRRVEDFGPEVLWEQLPWRADLGCLVARALLLSNPKPLPDGLEDAWQQYAKDLWRPGRPRRDRFEVAWRVVQEVEHAA